MPLLEHLQLLRLHMKRNRKTEESDNVSGDDETDGEGGMYLEEINDDWMTTGLMMMQKWQRLQQRQLKLENAKSNMLLICVFKHIKYC